MLYKLNTKSVKDYLERNYTVKGKVEDDWGCNIGEYYMKLFCYEKGLYSGIVYNKNRVLDFILDFTTGYFKMGGVSGRQLKNSVDNIRKILPTFSTDSTTSNLSEAHAVETLLKIGKVFSMVGKDATINYGKGLFRALTYAPQIEQLVKVAPELANDLSQGVYTESWHGRSNSTQEGLIALFSYARSIKPQEKSLRKLLNMSKGQYKTFISDSGAVNKYLHKIFAKVSINLYAWVHDGSATTYKSLLDTGDIAGETLPSVNSMERLSDKIKDTLDAGKKIYDLLPGAMSTLTDSKSRYIKGWLQEVDEQRNYDEAENKYKFLANSYDSITLEVSDYSVMPTELKRCLRVLSNDKHNLKHLVKYLYASCYHQQAMNVSEGLRILDDYYGMVSEYPGFVKYPRFLKTAHDVAIRNSKQSNTMQDRSKLMEQYQDNKDLEFKFGDWCSVVLASPFEVVAEGNNMHHCVGSYVGRIAKGNSLILSLRYAKSPDHSEITVEVSPDDDGNFTTLKQAFAQSDADLSPDQNTALATFTKLAKLEVGNNLGGTSPDKIRMGLNKNKQQIDLSEVHQKSNDDYQADLEEKAKKDNSWASKIKSA